MPYALAANDSDLVAGMSDGRVLHSRDAGDTWQDAGVRIGSIVALAAA
jgi:photosystem II stability/assembly factor-like uncharacterized protein